MACAPKQKGDSVTGHPTVQACFGVKHQECYTEGYLQWIHQVQPLHLLHTDRHTKRERMSYLCYIPFTQKTFLTNNEKLFYRCSFRPCCWLVFPHHQAL